MATLFDPNGSGTFIPVIPLPGGLTAGQLANAQLYGLQNVQLPGEGYTSGGLVTLPPTLQPGYYNQGPLVNANAAATAAVGAAGRAVGSTVGNAASGLGTAAHNAAPKLATGGVVALLAIAFGLYLAAQVVE